MVPGVDSNFLTAHYRIVARLLDSRDVGSSATSLPTRNRAFAAMTRNEEYRGFRSRTPEARDTNVCYVAAAESEMLYCYLEFPGGYKYVSDDRGRASEIRVMLVEEAGERSGSLQRAAGVLHPLSTDEGSHPSGLGQRSRTRDQPHRASRLVKRIVAGALRSVAVHFRAAGATAFVPGVRAIHAATLRRFRRRLWAGTRAPYRTNVA